MLIELLSDNFIFNFVDNIADNFFSGVKQTLSRAKRIKSFCSTSRNPKKKFQHIKTNISIRETKERRKKKRRKFQ